jgi:signal transduction histidine kinase
VLADIYLFEIEDDGPGIQDNMHERVFELFQTLKPRDEVEGSGMGLSILQKMMTTLGGEISLKPNSGRGTVFIVKWPKSL